LNLKFKELYQVIKNVVEITVVYAIILHGNGYNINIVR